ncbi:MAG: hypothetical protein GF421_06820 [Candidatus Aminicenantes bacterium]|nr:hypothetical protein [Candidatus Aminicenantes bacterium]
MKKKVFFYLPFIGLFLLVVASFLLYLRIPFMETWFYSFGWWSVILMMDGINFRLQGSSFLFRSPRIFVEVAFLSVPVWLVFELINISLKNWMYLDLPNSTLERWAGYFIAFATVIPALIELSELFQGLLPKKRRPLFEFKTSPFLRRAMFFLGILFLIVAMTWPRYGFPLVWICFILILEPLNIKNNQKSLLREIEQGHLRLFWSWCLAGFCAGVIWEFLNFYAGAKWIYSIPYFDFIHIFEMPLLGYLGFIPFALEIFAVLQLYLYLKNKISHKSALKSFFFSAAVLFDLIVFHLIDVHTSQL